MWNIVKKVVYKTYVVALMAFTIWYGYFITPLIFGHGEGEKPVASSEEEEAFEKLLKEQQQVVTTDIGFRIVKEQYVEGHFHHTGFTVEPDTHNMCIRCHGDVPHDRAKAIRAFLNMHAFYLACETCHIRPKEGEKPWVFRWYDKKTGQLIDNPPGLLTTDIAMYGNYGAKVAPGVIEKGRFRFLHGKKELEFVENYLKKKDKLTPTQQSKMKNIIHRRVNKQPLLCDACHTREKEPYLPFAKLGYPPRRINNLTSTEVVGLVKRYKEFYLPKFLLPGGGEHGERAVPEKRGLF